MKRNISLVTSTPPVLGEEEEEEEEGGEAEEFVNFAYFMLFLVLMLIIKLFLFLVFFFLGWFFLWGLRGIHFMYLSTTCVPFFSSNFFFCLGRFSLMKR